jgi:hypothetical protein
MLPYGNKESRAIEINIEPSSYTATHTDLFLQTRATVAANGLISSCRQHNRQRLCDTMMAV